MMCRACAAVGDFGDFVILMWCRGISCKSEGGYGLTCGQVMVNLNLTCKYACMSYVKCLAFSLIPSSDESLSG